MGDQPVPELLPEPEELPDPDALPVPELLAEPDELPVPEELPEPLPVTTVQVDARTPWIVLAQALIGVAPLSQL